MLTIHPKALLLSSALLGLLACQAPPFSVHPNTPQGLSAQRNLPQSASAIQRYYPIEAGHRWTFAMEQTQNGQDNTKFKTMIMYTEALPPENGAERAILRRVYPDSSTTPTPSLIKRFSDRVELSRYKETVAEAFTPDISPLGQGFIIGMQLPLEPGQSWEGRLFNGGSETITVKGLEEVNVPAGRFEALKIEHHLRYSNGKEDFLRYWYAPNIGMVKMYEELTFYYGQWLKFRSTGVLTEHSAP